jgi:predicted ATPase
MITRFRLENFKAHRDTNLALHQFTVLVGDNSSGKTSVLEALRLPSILVRLGGSAKLTEAVATMNAELGGLLRSGTDIMQLSGVGRLADDRSWTASTAFELGSDSEFRMTVDGFFDDRPLHASGYVLDAARQFGNQLQEFFGHAAMYRFRADQIAASAYSDQSGVSVAEDGAQTAVVLADLKLADDERFDRIEEALRRLVPSVERLRIAPAMVEHPSSPSPVRGSKLHFDFRGARNVPAHRASQGTLVVLALLTVLHGPNRPSVILLDDFDHSLHPRAQMELVRMIKDLLALDEFKDTQIVATTHSPYVLDEVSPSDVIAFALRDDGTVAAKPLSEHPDAPRVNGSLKAGELWTLDAERDWVR